MGEPSGIAIVRSPEVNLFSLPAPGSDVITKLKFGEEVEAFQDSFTLVAKDFLKVKTSLGREGYTQKKNIRIVASKDKYKVLLEEVDKRLIAPKKSFNGMEEMTRYLYKITSSSEVSGELFLQAKVKAGLTLHKMIQIYSEEGLEFPNANLGDILSEYSDALICEGAGCKSDPEYFWKISSDYRSYPTSDYAAFLGVRFSERNSCEMDVYCYLIDLESKELRYMRQFPQGKYVHYFLDKISTQIEFWLGKKDSGICPKEGEQRSISANIGKELANFSGKKDSQFLKNYLKLANSCHL